MDKTRRDLLKYGLRFMTLAPFGLELPKLDRCRYRKDIEILMKGVDYVPSAVRQYLDSLPFGDKLDPYMLISNLYKKVVYNGGDIFVKRSKMIQHLFAKIDWQYESLDDNLLVDPASDPVHADVLVMMGDYLTRYGSRAKSCKCEIFLGAGQYYDKAIDIIERTHELDGRNKWCEWQKSLLDDRKDINMMCPR